MNNKVQVFKNKEMSFSVRTLTKNGEAFFVGKDVADTLGYSNSSKAVSVHVDEEDKAEFPIWDGSQNRNTFIINESGFYSLVFSSKLPQAKQFKKWVTSEVLPTIRKHGEYISDNATPKQLQRLQEVITLKKITKELSNCSALELEAKVNEILETNISIKSNKREKSHINLTKNEYKQKIREHIRKIIINRIMPTDNNCMIETAVRYKILETLDREILSTQKRIVTSNVNNSKKIINQAKDYINYLTPKLNDYSLINFHAFSHNSAYRAVDNRIVSTDIFRWWQNHFPLHELPGWEKWGVDSSTDKVELFIKLVHKDKLDMQNLEKNLIDMIFNHYNVDDKIIVKKHVEQLALCNDYQGGKIYVYIRKI
jgi:prophage antirepressor-like protein